MRLLLICLLVTYVSSQCNYIRQNGRSYQMDTCSYSSTMSSSPISYGFYCDKTEVTAIALYREWNTINCPSDEDPTVELFITDCSGEKDDCNCFSETKDCLISTIRIENCTNSALYQETNYAIEICQISGQDTSQQIVCNNENNLVTMSYENSQCEDYGFEIDDNRFLVDFNDDISSQICITTTCQSTTSKKSILFGIIINVITILMMYII